MPPSDNAPQGFLARIHAHPQARLLEFLIWGIPGLVLAGLSLAAIVLKWTSGALPAIGLVIGISLIGWGLLPPRPPAQQAPPPSKSKRAR